MTAFASVPHVIPYQTHDESERGVSNVGHTNFGVCMDYVDTRGGEVAEEGGGSEVGERAGDGSRIDQSCLMAHSPR